MEDATVNIRHTTPKSDNNREDFESTGGSMQTSTLDNAAILTEVDPWDNITRNLSKVLDDESVQQKQQDQQQQSECVRADGTIVDNSKCTHNADNCNDEKTDTINCNGKSLQTISDGHQPVDDSTPVVVIRSRPSNASTVASNAHPQDTSNRKSARITPNDTAVSQITEYSSRAFFGDLAKNLSRYVVTDSNRGACSPPPGMLPLIANMQSTVSTDVNNGSASAAILRRPPIDRCSANVVSLHDGSTTQFFVDSNNVLRNDQSTLVAKTLNYNRPDANKNRHSIASVNELASSMESMMLCHHHHHHPCDLSANEVSTIEHPQQHQHHQQQPTVQIDHLMHLLSGRLCILEDSSANVDKKLDAYEYHARKKLEDCRTHMKERIDELIESYGKEIGMIVQSRRKCLQKLERNTEEHLAATNKLLTQAKLKLSRLKITADELHTLNERILDCLVKTKKLQREITDFECWLDFTPKDPLEADDCIGTLQSTEHTDITVTKRNESNWNIEDDVIGNNVGGIRGSTLNPNAENWEPPTQPNDGLRNYTLDETDSHFYLPTQSIPSAIGGVTMTQQIPVNTTASQQRLSCQPSSGGTAILLNCINRRSSWHPMMQNHKGATTLDLLAAATASANATQGCIDSTTEDMLMRGRRSTWTNCLTSPTASSLKATRHLLGHSGAQRMLIPCKNCIQLLPTAPNRSLTVTRLQQHQLLTSMQDDMQFCRSIRNRQSLDASNKRLPAASSLLSLDMQRPIVVDCYGEPPRHLKCIKGLTFMSPNRLMICENGRKPGHKNILMFSVTGCFLNYINAGTPYLNPTGICLMNTSANPGNKDTDATADQKLIVVDGLTLKLISADTSQLVSTFSLLDPEQPVASIDEHPLPLLSTTAQSVATSMRASNNSSGTNSNAENTDDIRVASEMSTFHRQDRFGGLHAVDNLVYVCDRKLPAIRVFDIRTNQQIFKWTGQSMQNPNFIYRKDDSLYVSDSANNSVTVLTLDGRRVGELRATYGAKNLFNNPCGICDDGENLAVADLYNNRIQLFAKDCLIGSIYSPCVESPFSIAYHSMGAMAISNGRPRTVTLYFSTVI